MALCLAAAAVAAGPIYLRLGTHRTVAAGMLAMAGGLSLMSMLGAGASFAALMPGFVIFGLGAGLMQVPLTNSILNGQPEANAGIASALLNAAREVAGLLGITVIGAILRATQSSALSRGTNPGNAFLDGYHAGLYVTIGLIVAGAVLSFLALRHVQAPAAAPAQVLASAEPEKELAGAGQH
jgi:MFS family permease